MDSESFLLFIAVLISLFSSHFTKSIADSRSRKICGTWVGLVLMFLVLEEEISRALGLIFVNSIVLSWCNRRYIHIVSFILNWSYLVFHHAVTSRQYSVVIFQMIALRMTGLASELHTSQQIMVQTAGFMSGIQLSSKYVLQADKITVEPDVINVLHYSSNFIGLLGGPYYRWTTFNDYLMLPVNDINLRMKFHKQRVKEIVFWAILYIWIDLKYPENAYTTLEFYWTSSLLYRFTYGAPRLILHVTQHLLITSIFYWLPRKAGLGLYPEQCFPSPGNGPERRFELMQAIRHNPRLAKHQHYSSVTVQNMDLHQVLTAPNMRRTLRCWDATVEYWMWAHVYRKIHFGGRNFKTAVTLSIWLMWWGATVPRTLFVATLWLYMVMEDVYYALIVKYTYGREMTSWKIGMTIFRFLCFVYLYPCLVIEEKAILWEYYCSLYWFYHGVILILLMLASYIMNMDFLKTIVLANLEISEESETTPPCQCGGDCFMIHPSVESETSGGQWCGNCFVIRPEQHL